MKSLIALASLFSFTAFAESNFVTVGEAVQWEGQEFKAYEKVVERFKKGFDYICGDVFCEGEYVNLTTVELECSVNKDTLEMGQCLWTIAGSNSEVDPVSGKFKTTSQEIFQCSLEMKGTLKDFNKLAKVKEERHSYGYKTLQTQLPGVEKSAYDSLVDCF